MGALLQTNKNKRRLAVDLGPKDELKELKVKKGVQLAAQGVVVNLGTEQVLIANKLKRGETMIEVDRMAQMKKLKEAKTSNGKESAQPSGAQSPKKSEKK